MKRLLLVSIFLGSVLFAAQAPPNPTRAQVIQMMKDISNWGRWGKDDELGTFNLITPEKRRQATRLVREGISISLAHNLDKIPPRSNRSF
jgi:hypothetical protein